MADELPDFPTDETDGQIISRSLSSSRSGRTRAPAIPQAFRERQQTAVEQDKEWRRDIEERKFEVNKLATQAQRDAAKLKAAEVRFSVVEKIATMREKKEEITHATQVMEELSGLDYKDGQFPNRVADIYKRNPRALDNPRVASFVDGLLGRHDNFLKDFRADVKTDEEKEAAKAGEVAAKTLNLAPTDVTVKSGPVTTKFEAAPGSKVPTETNLLTDINKRMKAEFDVDLGDVNSPAAKMRRVTPKEDGTLIGAAEDGSHYAFTVKRGASDQTVVIPVDRFKSYADEYAAAKTKPAAPAAPKDEAAHTSGPIGPGTPAGSPAASSSNPTRFRQPGQYEISNGIAQDYENGFMTKDERDKEFDRISPGLGRVYEWFEGQPEEFKQKVYGEYQSGEDMPGDFYKWVRDNKGGGKTAAGPTAPARVPDGEVGVSSDGKRRILTVKTKEAYDSVSSGDEFIDPEGVRRRKP